MAHCASCSYQRKKCPEDCVMARHFPRSRKRDFQLVHRVFGVSNVTKMLKDLDFQQQNDAVRSMVWEAAAWDRDPVLGPLGIYERLEEYIPTYRTMMQPLVRLESSPRWPNPQSQERSSFESNGRVGFQGFHQHLLQEQDGHGVIQEMGFGGVDYPSLGQDLERESHGEGGIQAFQHYFVQEQDRRHGVIQEMGFGGVDYPSLVQDLERESNWGGGIQAPQHYFVQGLERDSNGRYGVSDSSQNNIITVNFSTNADIDNKVFEGTGDMIHLYDNERDLILHKTDGHMEPYIGMEFESEDAAMVYYNAYAKRVDRLRHKCQ